MQVLKDEIQEKILQSSLELFLQHGFEKTSIEKIAKQAHISKSNLYNYFKSKFDGIINVTVYSQSPKELHFNLHRLIRYHIEGFSALISD